MEELKENIENINKKIESMENKFNMLIDTISKTIEKQNEEKVCREEIPYRKEREILSKTYDIVRRMDFREETRIWEERTKKCDDEIKKQQKEKECCEMELREIERKYYQEY